MAQLWCFVALSMISVLGNIIECDSLVPNSYSPDAFAHETVGIASSNSQNEPVRRKGDDCYHPVLGDYYCTYYVTFGEKKYGDKQVFDRDHKKPNSTETPLIVTVKFPLENRTNEYKISYIYVVDTKTSKGIHEDHFEMKKGGIGEDHFEFEIKSDKYKPGGYRVVVYGKPKK